MTSQSVASLNRWFSALVKGTSLSLGFLLLVSGSVFAQTSPSSTGGDVVVPTEGESQPTGEPTSTASDRRFVCQSHNGQPTVMYFPESQPGEAYPWATPTALGGGWTPQRRCEAISSRLESYRPDGLVEMQTGQENGYEVVCVTTERNPACRIVFTVPPGQSAVVTRDRVFENLTIADSGQQTQGVTTFTNGGRNSDLLNQLGNAIGGISAPRDRGNGLFKGSGGSSIKLKPFLDPSDGGTGTMLRGRTVTRPSARPGRRLNPDRFR